MKKTGQSPEPRSLCPDDDPLAEPILAACATVGGAPVVEPTLSSRGVSGELVEGDEAGAGETVRGTFRVCMVTAPLTHRGVSVPQPSTCSSQC